jgi:nucleotide-binding universal stress UspA family protein
MHIRKIFAPTDFSPASCDALRVAIRLAKAANAQLVIAHVQEPLGFGLEPLEPAVPRRLQELAGDSRRELDAAVADAKAAGVQRVTETLLAGIATEKIVEAVEADPAIDLVAIGTHGRTGIRRFLLGSVAEKVVRHAPCSVLVVRPDGEPAPFTDVLCPVDLADTTSSATSTAVQIAEPGGSGIALLHVLELPVQVRGEAFPTNFLADLEKSVTRRLDGLAAEIRPKAKVPVSTSFRIGYAASEILSMLDDQPSFDLVVMGSHGRTGIRRAVLGSVAEKVVRYAHCPVLVARPPR